MGYLSIRSGGRILSVPIPALWQKPLCYAINSTIISSLNKLQFQSTRDMALSDAAILLSEKKAVVEIEVKRDSPLYQLNTVTLDKPKSGW